MRSTIIITVKCLLFAFLIFGGCIIAESIEFDFDFSGTKTIEFEYREGAENIFFKGADGNMPTEAAKHPIALSYIDSIFQTMSRVSNLKLDTSHHKFAKISYDFESGGPGIEDPLKYDRFLEELPDELKWYFVHRPNTFQVLNKNQVLWKIIDVDLFNTDLPDLIELDEEMENVTSVTTLKFPREIKKISSDQLILSHDRKMVQAKVEFGDVLDLERSNEVVITFE